MEASVNRSCALSPPPNQYCLETPSRALARVCLPAQQVSGTEGLVDSLIRERFHHIIDCMFLESRDSVMAMCGDEYNCRHQLVPFLQAIDEVDFRHFGRRAVEQ
jgi:hypothetical protein